jgi:hypothetical protein
MINFYFQIPDTLIFGVDCFQVPDTLIHVIACFHTPDTLIHITLPTGNATNGI